MVPTAWRHAGSISAARTESFARHGRVRASSVIPCRVSSDPHERRNDFAAVSRRDPAELRYALRRGLRILGQKDPVELYCILALDGGIAWVAYVGDCEAGGLAAG